MQFINVFQTLSFTDDVKFKTMDGQTDRIGITETDRCDKSKKVAPFFAFFLKMNVVF